MPNFDKKQEIFTQQDIEEIFADFHVQIDSVAKALGEVNVKGNTDAKKIQEDTGKKLEQAKNILIRISPNRPALESTLDRLRAEKKGKDAAEATKTGLAGAQKDIPSGDTPDAVIIGDDVKALAREDKKSKEKAA